MRSDLALLLLGAAVLTGPGSFEYALISQSEAVGLLRLHAATSRVHSHIGHEATATLLSRLAGYEIPVNRVPVVQGLGQRAVVVRLRHRPPAVGDVTDLNVDHLEFGLLVRTA